MRGPTTKCNQAIVIACEKGYRYTQDGDVIGVSGRLIKGVIDMRNGSPYRTFAVRLPPEIAANGRQTVHPDIHRFIGYCLFGDDVLRADRIVYHFDGDSLNNRPPNLRLGTQHDASMARPAAERSAHARKAATALRKLSPAAANEIRELKALGVRTKFLAKRFGCSEPTVCDIVAGRIYRPTPPDPAGEERGRP